jgi:pectate lyase
MHRRHTLSRARLATVGLAAAMVLPVATPASAIGSHTPVADPHEAASVGWATANGGTDGGAGAPAESTYVVSDRAELLAALDNGGAPDEPKIVYVEGTIHGNETADGRLLGEQDYAPGYDSAKYLSCFVDGTWSDQTFDFCGQMRRLRTTGSNNLKRQQEIKIPSNTTLLGLGSDAGFTATNIMLHVDSDIVIRNLTMEAPVDWFSSWDPWDGEDGSWNARFDAMSAVTANNIWIDHVTFTDGEFPDSAAPVGPNGKPMNRHDGLFDLKDGADFITVTDSRFIGHEKTMLFGSGDGNADTDEGRLRVTLAGNYFEGTAQRSPRVRFGDVHVLNNLYVAKVNDPVSPMRSSANGGYSYFLGVGHDSSIVSEGNAFEYTGPGADESIIVENWNGTEFADSGSWFNAKPVDVEALAAAAYDRKSQAALTEAAANGTAAPEWALAGFTTDVRWDPAQEYAYTPLTSYADVKWHGKHATGAGELLVQHP